MYAHRAVQTINNLHLELDLPSEFADCETAEIIVLPLKSQNTNPKTWKEKITASAGVLGDDFPDDVNDNDLGKDSPRDFYLPRAAWECSHNALALLGRTLAHPQ